jgi:hypothetical protein
MQSAPAAGWLSARRRARSATAASQLVAGGWWGLGLCTVYQLHNLGFANYNLPTAKGKRKTPEVRARPTTGYPGTGS